MEENCEKTQIIQTYTGYKNFAFNTEHNTLVLFQHQVKQCIFLWD